MGKTSDNKKEDKKEDKYARRRREAEAAETIIRQKLYWFFDKKKARDLSHQFLTEASYALCRRNQWPLDKASETLVKRIIKSDDPEKTLRRYNPF